MRRYSFLVLAGAVLLLALALWLRPVLPAPSGLFAVGQTSIHWVDTDRAEDMTDAEGDYREISAVVWYPAEPGSGSRAPYLDPYDRLAPVMVASGEVSSLEVFGMRYVRAHAMQNARVAGEEATYAVMILSPGNATNVEFYSSLAEDLASHGYVVLGLNHPYDVTAMILADGSIASFAADQWPFAIQDRQSFTQQRIEARVQDVVFALEQLRQMNRDTGNRFYGRLNLDQAGVMGHSLGGITAAQACRAASTLKACLNMDGLQAGGPFSATIDAQVPTQPFMMITKESRLQPKIMDWFEQLPSRSYLVRVEGGKHDDFSDGGALTPWPPDRSRGKRVNDITRAYTLAFFEEALRGNTSETLAEDWQGVTVNVFEGME